MSAQLVTIAGAALLVLIVARMAHAGAAGNASDPKNWNYIRGFTPGTGYYT